jgi:hypothetical protein
MEHAKSEPSRAIEVLKATYGKGIALGGWTKMGNFGIMAFHFYSDGAAATPQG